MKGNRAPRPVVYVDTYTIIGQTLFHEGLKRIEVSQYLTQYPELHQFVVEHERNHAEFKLWSWRHFWIDTKDRVKLIWDPTLQRQLRDFRKHTKPTGPKETLFAILYQLFGEFQALFILMPMTILRETIRLIRWINRKRRT